MSIAIHGHPPARAPFGTDGETMALSGMLALVGAELEDAGASLAAVQDAVGDLRPGCLSADAMIALQALDLAEQTVCALAKILQSVSGIVPHDLDVDARALLGGCTLASLAMRLMGETPPPAEDFELL